MINDRSPDHEEASEKPSSLYISSRSQQRYTYTIPLTSRVAIGEMKLLLDSLHKIQRVIGAAADGALHVIREVALEDAHLSPLVIGDDVRGQGALGARVDGLEVAGHEGGLAVPSVHLGAALVPEEERAAVIRSQDDESRGFHPEIVHLALSVSVSQMIRADGEQPVAAQVREEQAGATVLSVHQREIQHVPAVAVHGDRLWEDDAISATRGHVVHQNRPRGRVGDVDEHASVRIVVRHDVLQSGRGARQAGQIDGFHDLE